MVHALVQHDFAVRYVAENGGRAVPLYYAVLEGSLLLWLLVLTGMTLLGVHRVHPRAGNLHPRAMSPSAPERTAVSGHPAGREAT